MIRTFLLALAALLATASAAAADLIVTRATLWTDQGPRANREILIQDGRVTQDARAGTDCGSPAHIQADAIWWELETWRQLAVPLRHIVRAATSLQAEMPGDPHAGHLGVGAHGDFVLYRGALDGTARRRSSTQRCQGRQRVRRGWTVDRVSRRWLVAWSRSALVLSS